LTGTVTKTKLKSGRVSWGYYFRAGKNIDGKWTQVVKKGFPTKKEAEEALRRALAEHETNPSRRDPRTFAEVFDTWILGSSALLVERVRRQRMDGLALDSLWIKLGFAGAGNPPGRTFAASAS
jgi:Arm DNA-binding domain